MVSKALFGWKSSGTSEIIMVAWKSSGRLGDFWLVWKKFWLFGKRFWLVGRVLVGVEGSRRVLICLEEVLVGMEEVLFFLE